ncbi:hypothetical protein ACVFKH_004612 [Salmonella enterica subsp. enterica]
MVSLIQLAQIVTMPYRSLPGCPGYDPRGCPYDYDAGFSFLPGTVRFHLPQLAARPGQCWRGLWPVLPPPT